MSEMAYKDFRQDELEYQYNPRVSVPEYPELAKVRAAQARRVASYHDIRAIKANCVVFNKLTKRVREFPTRTAAQMAY